MMFKKVCIVGCGLIGSSIARAIRKNRLSNKIVSSNRSDIINKKVIKLRIVDDYPPCIQIEPTSFCNFRCIMCYQSDRSVFQK